MNSNETNNDDIFDNFLKYEISDEDDDDCDDEFFDAVSDSNYEKSKNKHERLKSVSSENLSVTSLDEISQMRNEQFERFKRRENDLASSEIKNFNLVNNTFYLDQILLNDQELLNNEIFLKSILNKKLRDELTEIKNLNQSNDSTDNLIAYSNEDFQPHKSATIKNKTDDSYLSTELNTKYETDNSMQENAEINKNFDKFKTWPANNYNNNNNVQTLLNSINETQNTATHLKQTNVTNDKIKNSGIDAMKLASGTIGTCHDTDKQASHNVAYSIQSDEFISPVDKQIAAIFRMTSSNSSNIDNFMINTSNASNSDLNISKKINKRHTVHANTNFFDDDGFNLDDDDDDDDEEDDINNDKSEIKSLDNNTFKRIYKTANLDNLSIDDNSTKMKSKTRESIRRVFNKFGKVVKHVQNKAEEVLNSDQVSESDSDDININNETTKAIKFKAARSNKSSHEFANSQILQILNSNNLICSNQNNNPANTSNPQSPTLTNSNCIIWAMKFSSCGKLLATAGKEQVIRIWVLKSFYEHFKDVMRRNNNSTDCFKDNEVSSSTNNGSFIKRNISVNTTIGLNEEQAPFCSKPLLVFSGHTSDILDVSWSKNLFILSSSADKTCRLWHIYKTECLCTFYHSSIVSAISFHPKDDRYFISACLDGKLRLWNIADKKIVLWNDLNNQNKQKHNFITAISFCQSGRTIAVGTFDGKCILYHTEQLKYYSLINVRSTRGRNKRGSKITGIEVLNNDENKLLITSNDSRIRLYDLRDLSLVCKYKGFSNSTVHIKASLSYDDSFIISGSKNKCTYIWRTNYNFSMLNSGRRDRNMYWERLQAHNAIVTSALFHPKPQLILDQIYNSSNGSKKIDKKNYNGVHIFVSAAGCDGVIKVFTNKLNL